MTDILTVDSLTKQFDDVLAVDDISFSIQVGQCFGLLGPNGAGKTTTLEIIEGISKPTSGTVLYKGQSLNRQFTQEVGIQFQSTALPDFLTARDTLNLFQQLYQTALPIEQLITLCDLYEFIDRRSTKLSGGQRQRLLLAIALINSPDIIFLDEPTTGLDPQSRRHFWELIERIKQEGKTVVLTTHYMDEAEALCDELIIMERGKIIAEGRPADLLSAHFNYTHIRLDNISANHPALQSLTDKVVPKLQGVDIYSKSADATLRHLLAQQLDLTSMSVGTPTLEDLFIKLTGHSLRD